MTICGVVAEYNPFHNGHAYQLTQARAATDADAVVCVMSGHFMQRGEPAAVHKSVRVRAALLHGADMVLELPVTYATASAERFASAAAEILDESGIVDALCFGSESGDIAALTEAAHVLANEPDTFKARLREGLDSGQSFPAARSAALGRALTEPNDILGAEYIKAILRRNSRIVPHTITRIGAGYHSETLGAMASATAIRLAMRDDGWAAAMPVDASALVQEEMRQNRAPVTIDTLTQAFLYALQTTPGDALARIADISEGLENRIQHYAAQFDSMTEIAAAVKTKRYTLTRIKRAMLHILLGITRAEAARDVPYIRVLGFRRDAEALVRRLHNAASLPVVTNLKNARAQLDDAAYSVLATELRAAAVYGLAVRAMGGAARDEWREPMVMV